METNNLYEVKFNSNGKKVCLINGEEIPIISEEKGKVVLEDGRKLNIVLDKEQKVEINRGEDEAEGRTIITKSSENQRGSVLFDGTCPKNAVKGKKIYKVLYTPDSSNISNDRYITTDNMQNYVEVELDSNNEGEVKFSDNKENGEVLINASGGKELEIDSPYANFDKKTQVGAGVPIGGYQVSEGEYSKIDKTKLKERVKKAAKKSKKAALVLLIPVVIMAGRGCQDFANPTPTPQTPTTPSDETPDKGEDTEYLNVNIVNDVLNELSSTNPELMSLRKSCYENSESINGDIQSWMTGDKDKLTKNLLGEEFVGTSTSDGTPSSFHKVLNEKYYNLTEEEKSMVNTVTEISTIGNMDTADLIKELKDNGVVVSDTQIQTPEEQAEYKIKLIEKKTGYNLHEKDQAKSVIEQYEKYFDKQVESRNENIDLIDSHKETTEESIKNRPDDNAKESYQIEKNIHKTSLTEQKNKIIDDKTALKRIEKSKNIIDSYELINKAYIEFAKSKEINESTKNKSDEIRINEKWSESNGKYSEGVDYTAR